MITEEQLCKHLSQYNGEEVDSLSQVAKISFSGEELLEFVNSLKHPMLIDDFIGSLKQIPKFNLNHYREGDYGIDTEREYDVDGDYIDSYEIDDIILHLENSL